MRKRKSISAVSAVLLVGIGAGIAPANADQADVARAEQELREYSKDKDLTGRYADQLYHLAGVYRDNGMRQKSDATFQKFLTLWRQKPQSESEPHLLLGWAASLIPERNIFSYPSGTSETEMQRDQARDKAEHQQDLIKAAKIADDALAMASRMPPASDEKIDVLFSAISVYDGTGNKTKKQALIVEIDRTIATLEANQKLTATQIKSTAQHLNSLADLYVPMLNWRRSMNQPPVRISTGAASKHSYSVTQPDFDTAEKYRLRAMALYDKLPANDGDRIHAQRSIVAWYKLYDQTEKYNKQLCKLGAMLGTNNLNVLFPPPAPCPACGMG